MCVYCEEGRKLPVEYSISGHGLMWCINDRDKCIQGNSFRKHGEEEISAAFCPICGRKLGTPIKRKYPSQKYQKTDVKKEKQNVDFYKRKLNVKNVYTNIDNQPAPTEPVCRDGKG